MKRLFYFVALICFLFLTSCHNDDTPEVPGPEQAEKDSIERARVYKEYLLLSAFCEAEEQSTGNWRYTPTYGDVLYSTTPAVRYVAADNLEDAKLIFLSILSMAFDPAETVDVTPNDITYRIEGKGSLNFLASSDEKTIARIKVDFPVISDLKEIVFIPKDRWPNNGLTIMRVGDVYEDTSTKARNRFLCIQDTESSNTGKLITFDGETFIETESGYDLQCWRSSVKWRNISASASMDGEKGGAHLYEGMPTGSDFLILSKFLYFPGTSTITPEAKLIFFDGVGRGGGLSSDLVILKRFLLLEAVRSGEGHLSWARYVYHGHSCQITGYNKVNYWSYDYWRGYSFLVAPWIKKSDDRSPHIPSLCVTVDSSFDPRENMLERIYP